MIIIDTLLKVLRAIKRARFVEYIIAILAAILSVVVASSSSVPLRIEQSSPLDGRDGSVSPHMDCSLRGSDRNKAQVTFFP